MSFEEVGEPTNIVRVAAIFLIGVIVLSGIDTGLSTQMVDSTTLSLTAQPSDSDTVTIGGDIFEFDIGDGVISGHIPVLIGSTILETINNLSEAM